MFRLKQRVNKGSRSRTSRNSYNCNQQQGYHNWSQPPLLIVPQKQDEFLNYANISLGCLRLKFTLRFFGALLFGHLSIQLKLFEILCYRCHIRAFNPIGLCFPVPTFGEWIFSKDT